MVGEAAQRYETPGVGAGPGGVVPGAPGGAVSGGGGVAGGGVAGQPIPIGRRFEVIPGNRLTHLDTAMAEAFEARDKALPDKAMYALVCRPGRVPRLDVAKSLTRSEGVALVTPKQVEAVPWPPGGQERFVIIYEQPLGNSLVTKTDPSFEPWRDDEVIRKVVHPFIAILKECRARGVCHRAIRASNLFYVGADQESVVLGECVSVPPGHEQPAIYETIEMAMAELSGRGIGHASNDYYAFGVLLLILLTGTAPCAGMSDAEIVTVKIQRGSYAVLLGRSRVSLSMMEPLRGLLCDDPAERWSAEELEAWADGQQLAPKRPIQPRKASRAFTFAGKEYLQTRALAHAMAQNWQQGLVVVQDQKLANWLEQGYEKSEENMARADRVHYAHYQLSQDQANQDHILARVLLILDPLAPIRLKGNAIHLEAMGQVLALDAHKPEAVQIFTEIMAAKLPQVWLEVQSDSKPELPLLKKNIEMVEGFLKQNRWGFGIERCLYELNPAWPCQSSLFKNSLVTDVKAILPTLEKIALASPPERDPVDAHIAAFCAARLKSLPKRVFDALANPDNATDHRSGMLTLLATLQARTSEEKFPAMTRWLTRLVMPVVETFHNRPYRAKLAAKMEEFSAVGDLTALFSLVDNQAARRSDNLGFAQAKALFEQAANEIQLLEKGELTSQAHVLKGSRQASMLVSTLLSGMTLLILTLVFLT